MKKKQEMQDDMIRFDPKKLEAVEAFLEQLPEFDALEAQMLPQWEQRIREAIRELDALEPRREGSEEYDQWADLHEALEDALDEILDFMEL